MTEKLIERLIRATGYTAIVTLILIFVFLVKEGFGLFNDASPVSFLTGQNWYPISNPPRFGILPILLGSLWVTAGAVALALPFGIAAAIYLAEVAPPAIRETAKPVVELLASIPSVVIGFVGVAFVAPWIKGVFNLPTGYTALTGAVLLGFMALPTIISLSEDAIRSVPKSHAEASLALGASKWETIIHAVVPAAVPGIVAAAMLGVGRVVGETMAVLMVTGNAGVIPTSLLQPVRTMTATIAAEMGETVFGSPHYEALFAIGLALFAITFAVNLIADLVLRRNREVR